MRHPCPKHRESGGDLWRPMCSIVPLSLLMLAMMLIGVEASAQGGAATLISSGSIVTRNGTVIPPLPKAGRWTEFEGKSSSRYETSHFMYIVPNESPAIELYVITDKRDEAPDGVFEMGFVKGFVRGFASKTGFKYEEPVFGERNISNAKTRYASVQLSKGSRALWVYAYVYPLKPSLTFIVVTNKEGTQEDIETYLSQVKVR